MIKLTTNFGDIVLEMYTEQAPATVANFEQYVKDGHYDGTIFHRVINGFMAQTGDPTGTGAGGSKLPDLKAEFTNTHFGRGVLGMARTSNPNSANSQFFIMFADAPHLDGQYTVFGEVVSGMEFVDRIKKGDTSDGMVVGPDKIIKLQLASDAK